MSNHLKDETSPYLLQHAENPVDWYPWSAEAFDKARREDKPVFLSIGYSTCHWCHVMAHESFENERIAELLNRDFVCVKVDREERPDIDSIYMTVCQAFTGSGGWPTSVFMTADQKPFFAGTYFPPSARYGAAGLEELLSAIADRWKHDRGALLRSAESLLSALARAAAPGRKAERLPPSDADLQAAALDWYRREYDGEYGGFGGAPKFPAPHNLLFLMTWYQKHGDAAALEMAESTLTGMYRGGMFDHVGYGFCRYATDRRFLVPHFEKMLYDNALLILACCKAFEITEKPLYRDVAKRTAAYVLAEMTDENGAFYSAQDADSDGGEGAYYLFTPQEVIGLVGERDGAAFNRRYGVTEAGNFEGKSIPNLLLGDGGAEIPEALLEKLRAYRRERHRLHTDDKVLTSWNALMIAALCALYRVSRDAAYLDAAQRAQRFLRDALCDGDALFVSFRDGKRGGSGFLDDYANYAYALLALYRATLDRAYLDAARAVVNKAVSDFFDPAHGGFYLYGKGHEQLILRPKEGYDGAAPSGNSMMAYVLVHLQYLEPDAETEAVLSKQLDYLRGEARAHPAGYAMFLTALSDAACPPALITAVVREREDIRELPFLAPLDSAVRVLDAPTPEYPLQNGETTYYICRGKSCLPPTNDKHALRERAARAYSEEKEAH